MPVRRDPIYGGWFFRTTVKTLDGRKLRLFGTPGVPGPYQDLAATKVGALEAEQRAIRNACTPKLELSETKKAVPTFAEWFKGSFWHEWVIGRKNKPSEVRSKNIIFDLHLEPRFGKIRLDEITTPVVARFRADLVAKKMFKCERPEIVAWDFEQYARLLASAKVEGEVRGDLFGR